MIKYSFAVITYNSALHIKKCIDSIILYAPTNEYEIIVCDNNSKDTTIDIIKKYNSKYITIIENSKNEGFATACNQAAKISKGKFIVFCNSDIFLVNNKVFVEIDKIFENKKIGCYAPKVLNKNFEEQPSTFIFPPTKISLWKSLKNKIRYKSSAAKLLHYKHISNKPDWVLGAFMVIPTDIFFEIGLFDEKFFLNYEEIDFFWRLQQKGYFIFFDEKNAIVHLNGQCKKKISFFRLLIIRVRSERYYISKRSKENNGNCI